MHVVATPCVVACITSSFGWPNWEVVWASGRLLVSELQQLEEVCTKLDKHTEDPFKLPEASEQVSLGFNHQ